MMPHTVRSFALAVLFASCFTNANAADTFAGQPRLVVLTDIGNEPDDQMSFVRLLLYSNEIELEGLIATTSTWQKDKVQPETLRQVISTYGEVRGNLLLHAQGWPTAKALDALVSSGQPHFGMAAVGADKMTPGAQAIIRAADRDDPRPLFVSVWGGANTLAQALMQVRATRPPAELLKLVHKLRVYSISDQDDAGPWIRREFPELHYVVSPSMPDSLDYGAATWTGISGDVFYRNCDGADRFTVSNAWLDEHIRSKGPLGKRYPQFEFIMEGDTPSFLGLTNNGLESFRSPAWGGWGGRYLLRQPLSETRGIWTQGGDSYARVTSQDEVTSTIDSRRRISDQATIWRWRNEFQREFAARMDWTVKPFAGANHNPKLVVNGIAGTATLYIDALVGQPVTLDARNTTDPDGNQMIFDWFHYKEAGFSDGPPLGEVSIKDSMAGLAIITPTKACRPLWKPRAQPCTQGQAHVILAVTDLGIPALTSYRRVILRISEPVAP